MAKQKDIAKKCGVSLAAVSAAFRRPKILSPAVRERILKAAREMGYAQKCDTVQNIGLVANNFFNHYYGEFFVDVIFGILQRLSELKLRVQVFERIPENYAEICEFNGFILVGKTPQEMIDQALKHRLTFVKTCCPQSNLKTNCIYFDNYPAVEALTEYALEANHRSLAILTGETDQENLIWKNFLSAVRKTLTKNKLDPDDKKNLRIYQADYSNIQTVEVALNKLLSEKKRPTFLLCSNDLLAYWSLMVLKKYKIKVPEDISVTGFDGIKFPRFVEQPDITLTTVYSNRIKLGRQAVDFLLEVMQKPNNPPREILVSTELLLGKSCRRL